MRKTNPRFKKHAFAPLLLTALLFPGPAACFPAPMPETALELNAPRGQYFVSSKPIGITGESPRTVAFWAYNYSLEFGGDRVTYVSWGTPGHFYGVRIRRGQYEVMTFDGKDWHTGIEPCIRVWQHHVKTWDGSDLVWYINGAEAARADDWDWGAGTGDSKVYVGADPRVSRFINAMMADVRIYSRAVSPDEAAALYEGRQITDGLAARWPLGETSGETARDVSGSRNHGTLKGNPRWTLARPFLSSLPSNKGVRTGDSVELGPVELRNPEGEVSYQWYLNGMPLEGARGSSLTITGISIRDFGRYHVVVDDARELTPVSSSPVRLNEILGEPADWPMWQYDPVRSAGTSRVPGPGLRLQWKRELAPPLRAWEEQHDDMGKLDFDASFYPVVKGGSVFVPSSSTDSLSAYCVKDGSLLWRFYCDGPVRLAPVAWDGRVYFVSDDGFLYCVNAETGALEWRFRGGPSGPRLLGNERIISTWPARGGPLVSGGKVYFTAGIWPLHGVFVYSLEAATGEVVWVNDTTSSDYVALPHGGAYGYGGFGPQGYIADYGDKIIVAGGRTPPAYFDKKTGAFISGDFRPSKGDGHYAVNGVEEGGMGIVRNRLLEERAEELKDEISGEIFSVISARDRIFITTLCGSLYCFGHEKTAPVLHPRPAGALRPQSDGWGRPAASILRELGESEGYALVLGAGSGDLMRELLLGSGMHVIVVEEDASTVRSLREELAAAGMYGSRAAVIHSSPSSFRARPYLFSMVLSEDFPGGDAGFDPAYLEGVFELLRPYGGTARLGIPAGDCDPAVKALESVRVDGVSLQVRKPGLVARLRGERPDPYIFARRSGPLEGAGGWTHQYHDPGNTLVSRDERVRLPLGLLWFGGPNNHDILPRHSGGPRPQVAGGRQIFLGVETVSARCVYTGRRLWQREFPGIGHPFTNLELESLWQRGESVYMTNIPGATYIGSPFVTLSDAVYLRYRGEIHRLDPATGGTSAVYPIPGRPSEMIHGAGAPDWGHVSVQGDFLVATSEPHIFEDQELGWTRSYSGTSSRMVSVMDRRRGRVLWTRRADTGFRHNAIVSGNGKLFLIDGLSENAAEHLARRGLRPDKPSSIICLDIATGREIWKTDSRVFGTFLLYSREHDILIEGGSHDLRRALEDEPGTIAARRGTDGEVLWEGGRFLLPAAVIGEQLVPGRPGQAISIVTGQPWAREQRFTGARSAWGYRRRYGCNTLNASINMLLFRTGYAGFFDIEHDSGTGTFGGFRSGCTANMLPADGVLNALDYTRTCTCSYAHQTSLALIHTPGDENIEFWTRYDSAPPDPAERGINFGAPGRRVDERGITWHDAPGARRRHPSALLESGGSIAWVAASARVVKDGEVIVIEDLLEAEYLARIHFAELEEGVSPGERVFDVFINGEKVLEGFDITRVTGGPFRATVKEFSVSCPGALSVELRKAAGSSLPPVINGIGLELAGERVQASGALY